MLYTEPKVKFGKRKLHILGLIIFQTWDTFQKLISNTFLKKVTFLNGQKCIIEKTKTLILLLMDIQALPTCVIILYDFIAHGTDF